MVSNRVTELATGVYSLELRGAMIVNAGIVVGDDGVAVIDTGTIEADARAILEVVATLTDFPVRYVINTHHHGDHSFGNWWLLPAIVVGVCAAASASSATPGRSTGTCSRNSSRWRARRWPLSRSRRPA